jgi:hypothetical protein
MPSCRTTIPRGVSALALFLLVSSAAQAQFSTSFMGPYATDKLADGLYGFRYGAYRTIFLVSDEGVIVTDPMSPQAAQTLREEIRKITDKPVRYVVYTQSNWDRIAGGRIFTDRGAKIVAHQRCVDDLKETPNPDVVMPDITYDKTYTVRLSKVSLELYYFGRSHGECLSVLVPQPANMMMVANIVNPPRGAVPWNPVVPNLRLHNLIPFFQAVEDLAQRKNITQIIGAYIVIGIDPGTRKPALEAPVGSFAAVREQRQFWEEFFAAVKTGLDSGKTAADTARTLDVTPFRKYGGYREENLRILVRRVASLYVIGR